MADLVELNFTGDWRVVVQSRNAAFDQRVLITNAQTGGVIVGVPGSRLDVFGNGNAPWTLRIEHQPPGGTWEPSFVRLGARTVSGARITQIVESEDITTPNSDRDFDDVVVRLEKIGMVEVPIQPYAIWASAVHAMPEGIFETALGRYFAAVRVRNIWGQAWPATAQVGITARSVEWLRQGGITVVNEWSPGDLATFGQQITNGRVTVGALADNAETTVYFKLDVTNASARKHTLEVQVFSPDEPIELLSPRARAPIPVSRSTADPDRHTFTCEVDRGRVTVKVAEFTAEFGSLNMAVARAREIFGKSTPGTTAPRRKQCDRFEVERLRGRLKDFLAGKDTDICSIWRDIQRCCTGKAPDTPGGDWIDRDRSGLEFIVWPTKLDYTVDYRNPFTGQFGPIPYDDPWWKVALVILAILLTIAAFVSASADIANHTEDTVIGTMIRAVFDAPTTDPVVEPPREQVGSVDAALCELNDSRGRTPNLFSYLDAASDEANTTPIQELGGRLDTTGSIMTNVELANIIDNMSVFPDQLKVFKSGARTGLTRGLINRIVPIFRRDEHEGPDKFFLNQVEFVADPDFPPDAGKIGRPGDSGSLWLQVGSNKIVALNHAGSETTAGGTRIEDVMTKLNIRFGG